jgi:ABC-2 type transport system ATP-binding protein
MSGAAIELRDLSKNFQRNGPPALDAVSADLPAGAVTGVVGPDAAGKTTLMRLMAGLLAPTRGEARVLGLPAVAPGGGSRPFVGYMPQKFGLYEDLSVMDNLKLHARLRDVTRESQRGTFERLLAFTDLAPFTKRLAGRLSGGMKQKLGLACSLIGSPRVLLLDEPGVGVDPQSRRELWKMVHELSDGGMTVVWSTAYMDEAERCSWVLMLDEGRLLQAGPPSEFLDRVRGRTFFLRRRHGAAADAVRRAWRQWSDKPEVRDVLVQGSNLRVLLEERAGREADDGLELVPAPPRLEDAYMDIVGGMSKSASPFSSFPEVRSGEGDRPVIEARGLTKSFGAFVAARDISFRVMPGRIFGLLGPNGAGKSTTFRMLCGLSRPNQGTCHVDGVNLLTSGSKARSRMGYMAQKFSLYGDISTEHNIRLCGDLYSIPRREFARRRRLLVETLELEPYLRTQAQNLPLGQKQRLALLCATLHGPSVLFLDEPTSGVDPRTRREFWKHINALTGIGVAVLVTTHFMEEAEYCDEIALVYQGRIIASGTPDDLKRSARTPEMPDPALEDAFIARIENFARENPA